MKVFIRFFKIFFSFICTIVVIGFIMITIQNYTVKEVELVALKNNHYVKESYYFKGTVTTRDQDIVEIKAARDMTISDINIKTGQILDLNSENKTLFTLSTDDDYSSNNSEMLGEYTDKINEIREAMDTELSNISKMLGRQVNSINDLSPDEEIKIYAPSNGKITGLNIGRDNKINGEIIANIIDDSILNIPFTMTANEYPNISVGQEILVTYTGYEGYYEGKVININPNAIPGKDKISYIYKGVIEAKNPGLISPGVEAGIHLSNNGQAGSTLSNSAVVESYANQGQIKAPMYSIGDKEVYAVKLDVTEGQLVKKGQQIAILGGPAIEERLKSDIKSLKSKSDSISKLQKEIQNLYGDMIKSNRDNNFKIGEDGVCSTTEKIYVDYVAGGSAVRKNDVILRYRLCDEENLVIKATVDEANYARMSGGGRMGTQSMITYKDKEGASVIQARVLDEKKFDKYYELIYKLENKGYYRYGINESVNFEINVETTLYNVAPKTAIIPVGEIDYGTTCYVYVVEPEETMFGTVDVIRQKSAVIHYSGHQVASIWFMENLAEPDKVRVVNNINTVLRDGMRVKAK